MESEEYSRLVAFVNLNAPGPKRNRTRRAWQKLLDKHVPGWHDVIARLPDVAALREIEVTLKQAYFGFFAAILPHLPESVIRQVFTVAGEKEQAVIRTLQQNRASLRRENIFGWIAVGIFAGILIYIVISNIEEETYFWLAIFFAACYLALHGCRNLVNMVEIRKIDRLLQRLYTLNPGNTSGLTVTCGSCKEQFQVPEPEKVPDVCDACSTLLCPKCRSKESGMCPAHHQIYLQIPISTRHRYHIYKKVRSPSRSVSLWALAPI